MSQRKLKITNVFNKLAKNYDKSSNLISFCFIKYWRYKTIQNIKNHTINDNSNILDIATGTAELAIGMTEVSDNIIGIDLSEQMLKIANQKIAKLKLTYKIKLKIADAESLPFNNDSFDIVTCAFGIRNFDQQELALKEILRVLKPQGKLFILELSHPKNFIISKLFNVYSQFIMPNLGKLFGNKKASYYYLENSVKIFPSGKKFLSLMQRVGFNNCKITKLTLGIVAIYYAEK